MSHKYVCQLLTVLKPSDDEMRPLLVAFWKFKQLNKHVPHIKFAIASRYFELLLDDDPNRYVIRAARTNSQLVLQYLLKKGTINDRSYREALKVAITTHHDRSLLALFEHGKVSAISGLAALDEHYTTLEGVAMTLRHFMIVVALQNHRMPLVLSLMSPHSGRVTMSTSMLLGVVRRDSDAAFIERMAERNWLRSPDDYNALLRHAAYHGYASVADVALAQGAQLDDPTNRYVLRDAVYRGGADVVGVILERRPQLTQAVLSVALERNDESLVKLALSHIVNQDALSSLLLRQYQKTRTACDIVDFS